MRRPIFYTIILLACHSVPNTKSNSTGNVTSPQLFVGCVPYNPTGGALPINVGGSKTTGGTKATGSSKNTGGSITTGGNTIIDCPVIAWPDILSASPEEQTKKAVLRTFSPRNNVPLRALSDYEISATICSSWNEPLVLQPLDPGSAGSCEGNAADGVISTHPYPERGLYNESTARLIYENGTCVDRGCLIPCTCTSCNKAFCPTTNTNDTGTYESSVFAYLIKMGWVKGNQIINSTDGLALALTHSSGVIGIDYYYSMMSTDSTGQLIVNISSKLAGGHALHLLGWDAINSKFWGRNSWGKWGMCRKNDDCGYFWISPANMITLRFSSSFPVL
jgi:hypothetical protein